MYAGFWKRFAALLIDVLALGAASFVLAATAGAVLGAGAAAAGATEEVDTYALGRSVGQVFGVFSHVVFWLYFALMESSRFQGTLGKIALGIKVVDYYGRPIGFLRATGRYFGKYISSLLFCVGYLMAAFTERKQALHDMMASCLVVNR